eukprot:s1016_g9.t1
MFQLCDMRSKAPPPWTWLPLWSALAPLGCSHRSGRGAGTRRATAIPAAMPIASYCCRSWRGFTRLDSVKAPSLKRSFLVWRLSRSARS